MIGCTPQADVLEGLQQSKLSYSSHAGSGSPVHDLPSSSALSSPGYGDRASLAPHSAWEALLNSRLPFLLSENQAAADFLGLVKSQGAQPGGPASNPGLDLLTPFIDLRMKMSLHATGSDHAEQLLMCI